MVRQVLFLYITFILTWDKNARLNDAVGQAASNSPTVFSSKRYKPFEQRTSISLET